MTPELRASIRARARQQQLRLNAPHVDVVAEMDQAQRLFEDAGDVSRTRWMTLERIGYAVVLEAQPLHEVLEVPASDRLVAHVAAYRTQRGVVNGAAGPREIVHFFVERLSEIVDAGDRVVQANSDRVELRFSSRSPPPQPEIATFGVDVFSRVVHGFVAALHLQLGDFVL